MREDSPSNPRCGTQSKRSQSRSQSDGSQGKEGESRPEEDGQEGQAEVSLFERSVGAPSACVPFPSQEFRYAQSCFNPRRWRRQGALRALRLGQRSRHRTRRQADVRSWGALTIAFNNAGIEGEQANTVDCAIENWDRVMAVSLRGVWLCMKHELPLMLRSGGGAIVNCASIAGLVGFANIPAYTASKHGCCRTNQSRRA